MDRHVIYAQQFSRERLERLFRSADALRAKFAMPNLRRGLLRTLEGRSMVQFFYEESTRTRASFAMAAHHLGMAVPFSTENARKFSSVAKGESLEHSIAVLAQYEPDVIVMRHHEAGSLERAASVIDGMGLPARLINAGDGTGQHPTQALLDLYTIRRARGSIQGVNILIGGDLKNGRTVRSLAYLLAKYAPIRIIFAAPAELQIADDILEYLDRHKVPWRTTNTFEPYLIDADVVYWTRLQTERISDRREQARLRELQQSRFRIGSEQMTHLLPHAILMHPLPINDEVREIDPAVESDPRAVYLTEQVRNGMFIRMALLAEMLG